MAISGGPPAARVRFAHTARSARKPRFFLKFKRVDALWGVSGPCGALWKTRYDKRVDVTPVLRTTTTPGVARWCLEVGYNTNNQPPGTGRWRG